MSRRRVFAVIVAALACASACGGASAAPAPPPLTIHRAWLQTKIGAHQVAERASDHSDQHLPGEYEYEVQAESACRRRSGYVVDCPFSYMVGLSTDENYEICHARGRVTETGDRRYRFSTLSTRCQLINNETP